MFLVSAGATARSEPETKRSDRGESAGGRRPHGSALSPCRTRGQNQRPACQCVARPPSWTVPVSSGNKTLRAASTQRKKASRQEVCVPADAYSRALA